MVLMWTCGSNTDIIKYQIMSTEYTAWMRVLQEHSWGGQKTRNQFLWGHFNVTYLLRYHKSSWQKSVSLCHLPCPHTLSYPFQLPRPTQIKVISVALYKIWTSLLSSFTQPITVSCLLVAFEKLLKATISFVMSVRPSAWNNLTPTGRNFMKFDIWAFFDKLLRKFKFH